MQRRASRDLAQPCSRLAPRRNTRIAGADTVVTPRRRRRPDQSNGLGPCSAEIHVYQSTRPSLKFRRASTKGRNPAAKPPPLPALR